MRYSLDEYISSIDCEWQFSIRDFTAEEMANIRSKIISSYYEPIATNFVNDLSKELGSACQTDKDFVANRNKIFGSNRQVFTMYTREKGAPAVVITFDEIKKHYFVSSQIFTISSIDENGGNTKVRQDNLLVKIFFAIDNLFNFISNKVKIYNRFGGYMFVETSNPSDAINYVLSLLGWEMIPVVSKKGQTKYRMIKMYGSCE